MDKSDKGRGLLPVKAEDDQRMQPPREEKVFALAAKVFGNYLFREAIAEHAIHHWYGLLDLRTICSMRAVAKDWNDSVCKLLHQSAEPMFEMYLAHTNSLNDVVRTETSADLLDRFTQTFGSSDVGRTPTFELNLGLMAFQQDNYESLKNFLLSCGGGLVKITLDIPRNGGSMKGIFPNLSLPSLRHAEFLLDDFSLEGGISQSDNITNFLQSIFTGATCLKKFQMCHDSPQPYQSSVFEHILLPPTLEQVNIWGEINSGHLLVKNRLPNLKSLALQMSTNSMVAGVLTGILENVRGTLKKLWLHDGLRDDTTQDTLLLRFPVMEKLENLEAHSKRCVLEPVVRSLERFLPNLKTLGFFRQSSEMIWEWTKSKFCSVKELCLNFTDVNPSVSFNPELVGRIHLAFPNVTKLKLVFEQIPIPGLQCMFMEMTNLTDLEIRWIPGEDEVFVDWDSVLIGTPPELTAGIRAAPTFWEKIQINNDGDPSLRNLTELRSLSIDHRAGYDNDNEVMVSDLAFHFAFLKMPRLQKLKFCGRTLISREMRAKWKLEGRWLALTHLY